MTTHGLPGCWAEASLGELYVYVAASWQCCVCWRLQDEKRDRFKLILNCIMIITSVIPPGEPAGLQVACQHSGSQ